MRKPLLTVALHEPNWVPALMALCAGYELGAWRRDALIDEVFRWLPSFVLPWSDQQATLASDTAVELIRLAMHRVYETDKYQRRGEFGELILHGVLRQEYGTEAALSKIWFKDAANDTVKGFDVVHISTGGNSDELHLWLGEAKFYGDLATAVRDAAASLAEHTTADYLRREFTLIGPKVDDAAPYAARLLALLDKNTSLDNIFAVLHIPVLVTFDSAALGAHTSHCPDYFEALRDEVCGAWESFRNKFALAAISIDVIFVPLLDKQDFVMGLHDRLKAWQQI